MMLKDANVHVRLFVFFFAEIEAEQIAQCSPITAILMDGRRGISTKASLGIRGGS